MMAVAFWIMCFAVMAIWAVAECIVCKEAIRICRNTGLRRIQKLRAVATVVADVVFAGCFLYMAVDEYGGYWIFEWQDFAAIGIGLALASVGGLIFGASLIFGAMVVWSLPAASFGRLPGDCAVSLLVLCAMAFMTAYFFVGAFVRGKMVWNSPQHSKWRTAFVFLVTYWPLALLFADMARY